MLRAMRRSAMSGERFQWQPTPKEVADIVAELRPMIAAIAHRQTAELALLPH